VETVKETVENAAEAVVGAVGGAVASIREAVAGEPDEEQQNAAE
jgi:hypothetical protein